MSSHTIDYQGHMITEWFRVTYMKVVLEVENAKSLTMNHSSKIT